MPPKKRGASDAGSHKTLTTSAPSKRQRVSLACDSCRTAREKCDGGRPECETCVSQNRTCSYTPRSKKRGIPTGYLRTIELSLAWLFENVPASEGALRQFLTQNDDGGHGAHALTSDGEEGRRLQRRWNKSKARKEMGRLLSDGSSPFTDTSSEDSGVEANDGQNTLPNASEPQPDSFSLYTPSTQEPFPSKTPAASSSHLPLRLPSNWRRLIEIYFSYTHCWLPILDRDAITSAAVTYPAEGLVPATQTDRESHSCYAELWAALAVASFQDAASSDTLQNTTLEPWEMLSTARSFIPAEEADFELSDVRATLVQSLVLLGQGKDLAAWLLIGTSSRLTLHLQALQEVGCAGPDAEDDARSPVDRTLAACVVLDTLVSVCIRQPPRLIDIADDGVHLDGTDETSGLWNPVRGLGPTPTSDDAVQPEAQPDLTLNQLLKFCRVWGNAVGTRQDHADKRPTPDDLVKSLEPPFAFCNSLIFDASTPMMPSAFLIKTMFLATTIELVPGRQTSLLSNFVEVIESGSATFGAGGIPPVLTTLIGAVYKRARVDEMQESERKRWAAMAEDLKRVWLPARINDARTNALHDQAPRLNHSQRQPYQPSFIHTSLSPYPPHADTNAAPSGAGYTLPGPSHRPSLSLQNYTQGDVSAAMHMPSPYQTRSANMSFLSPTPSGGAQPSSMWYEAGTASQLPIDYDAILEELGCLDYADGMDMDAQFMTNLGFAPGCDPGDMFQ